MRTLRENLDHYPGSFRAGVELRLSPGHYQPAATNRSQRVWHVSGLTPNIPGGLFLLLRHGSRYVLQLIRAIVKTN